MVEFVEGSGMVSGFGVQFCLNFRFSIGPFWLDCCDLQCHIEDFHRQLLDVKFLILKYYWV